MLAGPGTVQHEPGFLECSVAMLTITQLTHREAYSDVGIITVVIPVLATLAVIAVVAVTG